MIKIKTQEFSNAAYVQENLEVNMIYGFKMLNWNSHSTSSYLPQLKYRKPIFFDTVPNSNLQTENNGLIYRSNKFSNHRFSCTFRTSPETKDSLRSNHCSKTNETTLPKHWQIYPNRNKFINNYFNKKIYRCGNSSRITWTVPIDSWEENSKLCTSD